ncbi:hypothetical protein [Flavobacterium silvisoli]|nr:hypothetical protein [Flavobacterium silvisoli]
MTLVLFEYLFLNDCILGIIDDVLNSRITHFKFWNQVFDGL